ncbi:MAG: ribosome recycling factor [Candidatus Pacebacteria bacterium]|nr:ribosome recycling factor [Candidatus Paceibacterota bacterium]
MEYQEIIKNIKPEFEKVTSDLKEELLQIRTSRPSANLVEGIQVECFGKKMPLKSLAMITMSGARDVVIQPWDVSYIEEIEKALKRSVLELSPINEKERLRITFPPLSEELRKRFIRLLSEKGEEARKNVRYSRQKAWKQIQDGFADSEISQDDKFRGKDKLQELVDEYQKKIEEMVDAKKKDIME